MILDETYNLLKTRYKPQIENLTISDVRLGIHLSAVGLSDGSVGVASTLLENEYHCIKKNRDFEDFTPAKITGQKVTHLFEIHKKSSIIDTLKIAVLNAFSSTLLANGNYRIVEHADPIDLLDLNPTKTVTIVGAFHSYIQKVSASGNKLHVLELNEDALIEEYKKYYVPAADYQTVIPHSDIVIITGLTLVNNTIDGLLDSVTSRSKVIVTGPSSSLIPDILFQNKVAIIGATRITKPDLLFSLVSQAGAGFHLFKYCAEKICVVNEQKN
jgi:uncharacterized protein (DUF4213/DUF364 family)